MKYILDTDTLIYFLKAHKNVVAHFADLSEKNLATTIINHAELLYGAFNSHMKKQNLAKVEEFLSRINILPFCKESSYVFAKHKAILKQSGTIIADLDLMIASIALHNHCILVTNNLKHFTRLKHLKLENWYN